VQAQLAEDALLSTGGVRYACPWQSEKQWQEEAVMGQTIVGGAIGFAASMLMWLIQRGFDNWARAKKERRERLLDFMGCSIAARGAVDEIRIALEPFGDGMPQDPKLEKLPVLQRLAESPQVSIFRIKTRAYKLDAPKVYEYASKIAVSIGNLTFSLRPPDGYPRLEPRKITENQTALLRSCDQVWKSFLQLDALIEEQLQEWAGRNVRKG
jgi:hypothetical protein